MYKCNNMFLNRSIILIVLKRNLGGLLAFYDFTTQVLRVSLSSAA